MSLNSAFVIGIGMLEIALGVLLIVKGFPPGRDLHDRAATVSGRQREVLDAP